MFDWKEILDFWFGELDEHGLPDSDHRNKWFRSDRRFDQEIRRRFLSMVLFASEQGLDHWRSEAGGILAEIILLDQFSRNIFRGGAMAFDQDRQARKLCRQAMQKGHQLKESFPISWVAFCSPQRITGRSIKSTDDSLTATRHSAEPQRRKSGSTWPVVAVSASSAIALSLKFCIENVHSDGVGTFP